MLFLEEKAPSVRLAIFAMTFIAGEACGFALHSYVGAWGWVGFFSLVILLAAYGFGLRHVGIVSMFMLGFVLALKTDTNLRNVIDDNSGMNGARPSLDLVVESEVNKYKIKKTGEWRADFLSHAGPVPLKVVVPVGRGKRAPKIGETWQIDGWISRKQDKGNRFARRMLWVGDSKRARKVSEAPVDSVRVRWNRLCEEFARRVGMGLEWRPDLASLNRAILLGRRSDLSRERKRVFANAGTIHVFAISGLHVMVVALIIRVFLTRLGIGVVTCSLLCVPMLWGYVVLTGARPSAIRAATMASLMLAGPIFGRKGDSLAAWSLTLIGVYALEPERFFDLGCALSFVVMFGIVFWCHWSAHYRPIFKEGTLLNKWSGDFAVSFAAWVAGVPIAAYAFGRFTPGGLLANFVVIRLAGYMVQCGAGGLVATFVCAPLAVILNNSAAACTWGMTYVSEKVASLPFSNYEIEPWSMTACVVWYAAWFVVMIVVGRFLPKRSHESQKWW